MKFAVLFLAATASAAAYRPVRFSATKPQSVAAVATSDASMPHSLGKPHSVVAAAVATNDASLPYSLGVLRQGFFDAIVPDGINVLSGLVNTITVPDVKERTDIPVVGKVDLTLDEIQFVRLDASTTDSSITIRDGFVQGVFRGIQLEIRAHWKYRKASWPNISGSGRAKVTSKNGKIDISLAASFDPSGHVRVGLSDVNIDLAKFDVEVTDGNASWLYNIIFDIFNGALKNALTNAVRDAVRDKVPELLNELFTKQPLDVLLLKDKVHLNTQFFGSGPVVQGNPGLVVASNRVEFSNVDLQECPYAPNLNPAFPPSDFEPSATFVAYADLAFVKCFAWAVRTSNAFSLRATPDILPPGIAVLSVEAWEEVFPAVAKLYKGEDFNLVLSLGADPDLKVDPVTGISGRVNLNADWFIASNNAYVLTTEITLDASVLFGINQDFATGQLHLDVDVDEDSVAATGRILKADPSLPRDGLNSELFGETLGELAPILASVASEQLAKGFDLLAIPVARLRNPKIVYDKERAAVGLASQISLVPL